MVKWIPKAIIFYFLFFIINPLSEAREECWIVSGAQIDQLGSFSKSNAVLECIDKTIINGVECTCFQCWKGCSQSIENAYLKTAAPLNKVTILQGAHGIPGGGAVCNKADNSGDEILNVVEKISKNTQVGLIIHSCYSGDLVSKKLIRETQNPSSPMIRNSCVITASTMGKVGYAYSDDLITQVMKETDDISLSDLFKKSFKYGGLISSAQWSTIYLDQYLSNLATLSLADAVTGAEKLNDFVSSSHVLSCLNDQQINPMFNSPGQKIIHDWSKEGEDVSDKILSAITLLSLNWSENIRFYYDTEWLVHKKRNKFDQNYLSKCRQYFEGFDGKNLMTFCQELETKNQEFKNWFSQTSKVNLDNPIENCLEEFYSDKEKKVFSEYWYWRDKIALCPQMDTMFSLLAESVKSSELINVLANKDIKSEERALKLLKLYKSSQYIKQSEKPSSEIILNQILGKGDDISEKGEGDSNRIFDATSAHLLESWVRHNLDHPIKPSDPIDDQRLKACDNFKIKVSPR